MTNLETRVDIIERLLIELNKFILDFQGVLKDFTTNLNTMKDKHNKLADWVERNMPDKNYFEGAYHHICDRVDEIEKRLLNIKKSKLEKLRKAKPKKKIKTKVKVKQKKKAKK